MNTLAKSAALVASLLWAGHVLADSAAPVERRSFLSSNREYSLEVDPGWDRHHVQGESLLTLRRGATTLWKRSAEDFDDFDYPLDVKVSDDGNWLVFGGYSAHNISFDMEYREGLRFYGSDGKLVRFVSRRDLPAGGYGISTAAWYDAQRTRLRGTTLEFFTPGRPEPLLFDVTTGNLLQGHLVPGQGDDSHREEWFRRRRDRRPSPHKGRQSSTSSRSAARRPPRVSAERVQFGGRSVTLCR